jgi:trk system potassium uptake protein
MKTLVIGLGNFGSTLAKELTKMGHEVIGVDKDKHKADLYSDEITYTMAMDTSDKNSLNNLPLDDIDLAIVAIGEDFGSSMLTSALLREKNILNLYCRAISDLHKEILESIGVSNILFPEQMSAQHFARSVIHKQVIDYYQISEGVEILKIIAPPKYLGLTLGNVKFWKEYNIQVLSVLKPKEKKKLFGTSTKEYSDVSFSQDTVIDENDCLILCGSKQNVEKFIKRELDSL